MKLEVVFPGGGVHFELLGGMLSLIKTSWSVTHLPVGVGTLDELSVGLKVVGASDGIEVDDTDGASDGLEVDEIVGESDERVVDGVGARDERLVGVVDGNSDGPEESDIVGSCDGLAVEPTEPNVGLAVSNIT